MNATTAPVLHEFPVGHHFDLAVEISTPEDAAVFVCGSGFTDDQMDAMEFSFDPEYLWGVQNNPEQILAHIKGCNCGNPSLPDPVLIEM